MTFESNPAPGSRLPAPGSRLPAPGSRLPAPFSVVAILAVVSWGGLANAEDELATPLDVLTHPRAVNVEVPARHPLLSDDVAGLRAEHASLSDEEFLRHLHMFDATVENEDGSVEMTSGVEWVEPVFEVVAGARPFEPRGLSLDDDVAQWAADISVAPASVPLRVSFDRNSWNQEVSVMHQQHLAMLAGTVQTEHDLFLVRQETVERIRVAGEAAMATVLAEIEAVGGRVVSSSGYAGSAIVELPSDALAGLLLHPEILRIEHHRLTMGDDGAAGYSSTIVGQDIDGFELQDILQTVPFYLRGYFGGLNEFVGVTEHEFEVHNLHLSFGDGAGNSRVFVCGGTSHTACTFLSLQYGQEHVTWATSVLASDLVLGQDPLFTNPTEQRKRSGVARRSTPLTIDRDDEPRVIDILSANAVYVLSQSSSEDGVDPYCLGADGLSRDWNTMYEAGIALINSEGNQGHLDPADCTMSSPASAIGVLPITPYRVASGSDTEVLLGAASLGGVSLTEGGGRTIAGLVAPTYIGLRAEKDVAQWPQYETTGMGGSSGATPTVSGAPCCFENGTMMYMDR